MLKKIHILLFLLSLPLMGSALHIVGGDVTYRCLGRTGNTILLRVTFTMYRDALSGGAPFDNDAKFGIFVGNDNNWRFYSAIDRQNVKNVEVIPINDPNPCLIAPTNLRVERGIYEFDVRLPVSTTESYMIAYQRCCRNNTISNLVNPGDAGAAFTVIITPLAQSTCNSSPTFNDFPPVVICNNEFIDFDHGGTDADGDQLVYEFCAPLTAGGKEGVGPNAFTCGGVTPDPANCLPPFNQVTFRLPVYSFFAPMAGNPVVNINPVTGIITGRPTFSGQYVVGVCIKEYRNGELLSIVQRDFQFNVVNCARAVEAAIDGEGWNNDTGVINLCGTKNIELINLSELEEKIESYDWIFDIQGVNTVVNTRNLSFEFPDNGTYRGKMILNKNLINADNCKDSIDITVNVFPGITADFMFDYDTCVAGEVDFTDLSFSESGPVQIWNWALEDDNITIQNHQYLFSTPGNKDVRLVVTDLDGCNDTIQKTVSYFPVPGLIIVEPDNFVGCRPGEIFFENLSQPIDETYNITWNFGDGQFSNEISPRHIYDNVGLYTVELEIVSPIGCRTGQTFRDWITILDKPEAGFSFTPDEPTIFNNTVTFIDESSAAAGWLWEFGESGISLLQNPTFTFRDSGMVEVRQIVRHISGCTDTAIVVIDISPIVLVFFPNAFTPNGDGLNDTFFPKGYFSNIDAYELSVWNRWGEKIFSTQNAETGWNGNVDNEGVVCPSGVYIFKAKYITARGELVEKEGQVTLIR